MAFLPQQGQTQNQRSSVSSPAGVPTYAKPSLTPGLTPDQLKFPAAKKRRVSSNNSVGGTPIAATPDEAKASPSNSPVNKKTDVKREKTEAADKKSKNLLKNLQKRREMAETQPLSFFITALGEALDISEEDVNASIARAAKGDQANLNISAASNTPGASNSSAVTPLNATNGAAAGATKSKAVTPNALLRTPLSFSVAKTPHSAGKNNAYLLSVPEEGHNDNKETVLPNSPPWTGNVQAVAIKNAFQSIDIVKANGIQFLTPPEDASAKSSSDISVKAADGSANESVMISDLRGIDGETDIWDYDSVLTNIGKNDDSLKREFWTLAV